MSRPYPSYRESGVEWLGELPEHWEVKRLKFLASTNDETLKGEDPLHELAYVDISSVDLIGGIVRTEQMVFEDAPTRARRLVQDGDTIVSTVRTYLRAIAPVRSPPAEMVVSTGFAVIRPRGVDSGFVSWVLRENGLVHEIVARSNGVGYPAIQASQIGELPIPLPRLDEQKAISAFLDRETERVDALVAKKRLLIERLDEYRVALIAHTVTHGLPPDAARAAGLEGSPRLKPSNVEWLRELPEHWEVKPLKFVASTNDATLSEDEHPLRPITYVDISSVDSVRGIVQVEEMVFEDAPSRARRLVQEGDALVSTVRTYLRAIAPVCSPPPDMVVSTGFAVIRPRTLNSGFTLWVLREHGLVEEIVARSTGVSYPAINAAEIGDIPVPIPPAEEQAAIADFLDREMKQIDALSGQVAVAIERLNEYRSSLITSAVTGKTNVREPRAFDRAGDAK